MIIGHQKIISQLDKAIKNGNLSHAYLFTGPEHLGKFTMALDLAEKILGDVKETNPDLIIIRPEIVEKNGKIRKKDISVENIRELTRKIMLAPASGQSKIAIIDDADCLNISAQNALLKTLEEPPANAILILIAQDYNKLLPTIVSRCQWKKFNLVSEEDLAKIIPENNLDWKEIIFWSLGRPGLAKIYLENRAELAERRENLAELKKLFSQSVSEKFAVAEAESKDTTKLIARLEWWLVILRETFSGGNNISCVSSQKALALAEKIAGSIQILKETNSNARLVLENLLLDFKN